MQSLRHICVFVIAWQHHLQPLYTSHWSTAINCIMLIYIYIYTVAQDLSILCDPKEMAKGKTSGQNPNAGWFNRFVQTGKSDHETKSNECFGG